MSLTDAITFLRQAVEHNMLGNGTAMYVFHEGMAFARSPAILAAHPVAFDGTFALPADDLNKVLARLGDEPVIDGGDGTMILKKGKLRSTLQVLEVEPPVIPVHEDWISMPSGLMTALRTAALFVSEDGTWQRGVHFTSGCLSAINNRSAINVMVPELSPMDAILSGMAADYLPSLPVPTNWIIQPNAFTFGWHNGAWVCCQLINAEWPQVADRILKDSGNEAPIKITDEWRDAISNIAVLGDGAARVTPNGITGTREHSSSVYGFDTGVTKDTVWSVDLLQQIFATATAWNPDANGAACFVGDNLQGVAMRRRGI